VSELQAHVTPGMMVGAVQPDGTRLVSPEAQDVLDRLKAHYQSLGKPSAASNYHRHLKSFFAWAENHGHSVRGLPADAVETFLSDLRTAGQKESTVHVMRTQIKSALREAHNALGVDFAHLEYQTGKPREVRRAQKDREKAKRQEKRMAQTIAQAQAIMAAQSSGQPLPRPDFPEPSFAFHTPAPVIDLPLNPSFNPPEETPMSTATAPATEGTLTNGAAGHQQPVVVVQMPPQNQRPTSTIGSVRPAGTSGGSTTTVGKGMTINNHTFSGPYVRISRMADGTDPLTPPGTETYITTVPLTQLLPHGDVAAYLQSFIMPNLRLSQLVSQVHFVFHELNDRRQPTGRRDELVVSMPMGAGAQAPAQQAPQALGGLGSSMNGLGGSDRATDYLLRKLDEDASSAKRRADELQEKLRTEKDSQNMFLLMQQFQKEQDLRRELENQKQQAVQQMQQMQMMSMTPPPMPMPVIDPPKPDTSAEMVKALAENQARMMETMMSGLRQPPPPPQKDAAEWLIPFISQMNQQAQVQQQANQQMLVGIMQANQQFMQAMLQKESPVEKMLMAQLQEVKAEARAPKGDDMEDFAEKLQKMKMVSDMLGGGGGGGGSLISELLSNAEAIGEGAAKIIAASKNQVTLPAQPSGPMLNGAPPQQALPPAGPQQIVPPPAVVEAVARLEEAAKNSDDQGIVTEVLNVIRGLIDAGMPHANMGNRLLNAFKDMDDEAEMFTFAKSMWIVAGKKVDKALAKVVAAVLVKWYTDIHEQLFGKPRAIGEEIVVEAAEETDEDEDEDEDSEDEDSDEDSE